MTPIFRHLIISVVVILALRDGIGLAWDPTEDLSEWYAEGRRPESETYPHEIQDPFFEFVVAVIEGDSLGVWTRADLEARLAAADRTSRLPVARLVSLERRVDASDPAVRRLRLELDAPLDLPVPWSLLGYHPGSLLTSRVIEAREIGLPPVVLHLADDAGRRWAPVIHVLTIETGHMILDVDGFVDKLLGAKLDDTWFTAFVIARVTPDPGEDALQAMALGLSHDRRRLVGAFDFRRDKILPDGRPIASALSIYCRRSVHLPESRAWSLEP